MKKVSVSSVAIGMWAFAGVAMAQALNVGGGGGSVGQQGLSVLSLIGSILTYLGVGTVTCAVIVQGYKIIFKQHRWSDVGNVLVGAAFIGGASTIAGLLCQQWG